LLILKPEHLSMTIDEMSSWIEGHLHEQAEVYDEQICTFDLDVDNAAPKKIADRVAACVCTQRGTPLSAEEISAEIGDGSDLWYDAHQHDDVRAIQERANSVSRRFWTTYQVGPYSPEAQVLEVNNPQAAAILQEFRGLEEEERRLTDEIAAALTRERAEEFMARASGAAVISLSFSDNDPNPDGFIEHSGLLETLFSALRMSHH
jgi:hypothetical protein